MKNEFAISFDSDNTDRTAYRVSLPGITARLSSGQSFSVKDLSATGISLICPDGLPPSDRTVFIDLYVSDRLYLARLKSLLVRGGPSGLVAYSFVDMDQQQEYRLDKLVLSVQKQLIELRKIRGESS